MRKTKKKKMVETENVANLSPEDGCQEEENNKIMLPGFCINNSHVFNTRATHFDIDDTNSDIVSVVAAKLGRRSRKMREMINEATRTIEDSQTAQALHGLLSLKSPETSVGNNFPALLRAVGQHIKPVDATGMDRKPQQIIQMPDGMIYEVSEVPAPMTTIVIPSPKVTTSTDCKTGIAPVVMGQIRPTQGQGSGSMVKLLLQMQSQADAAASAKKLASTPSMVEVSPQVITTIPPLTISPGTMIGQPKLGRPVTKVVSPSSSSQPIILQHSKSSSNSNCNAIPLPIHLVGVTPSSPMVQIIPQSGDVLTSPILPQLNGQPLLIPTLVTATTTAKPLTPSKQSPLRKRQHAAMSHPTMRSTLIAPPLKIQKTLDSAAVSRTVMTTLQARSSVLPGKSNLSTTTKPSSELAAVIMPMLEPVKTDTQLSESPEVPDIETLTAAIIKGFREIFEHIQTQLTDLKKQNNSADGDEPGKVKPMVSRVIAEQINTPVRDEGHSTEPVSCNRKWEF